MSGSAKTLSGLQTILPCQLSLSCSRFWLQTRSASHAAQGQANKAARGPGKRLGAKRGATELVVPGNIIFRQRGTHWFAGENCGMGRDHTIFAKEKGYVVYYRDKWRGKGYGGNGRALDYKKFIGVVFERGQKLPRPEGHEKPRRLGMVMRQRSDSSTDTVPEVDSLSELPQSGMDALLDVGIATTTNTRSEPKSVDQATRFRQTQNALPSASLKSQNRLLMRSNREIGRAAENAGVEYRKFEPGNRFLAWRKRTKRILRAAQAQSLKKSQKQRGQKKNKTVQATSRTASR